MKRPINVNDSDKAAKIAEGWKLFDHAHTRIVNANELAALRALTAYVAQMTGRYEYNVERQFADRFNIPNMKCLPTEKYDAAIRYLVDQVPPTAV